MFMMFLFSLGPVGVKPEIWISAAGESLSLTDQHPFAAPDTNAVSCAGGELGPAAELTVLLAGQLTQLRERRHGAGKLQASFNVSLSTILFPAWNSYRRKKHTELVIGLASPHYFEQVNSQLDGFKVKYWLKCTKEPFKRSVVPF